MTKTPDILNARPRPGTGVVVGRFQVPELHAGHRALLAEADQHQRLLVVLGVASVPVTRGNPMDFATRQRLIQATFPHAMVVALPDEPSDERWCKHLDRLIRNHCPLGEVALYGGRDSFATLYDGRFPLTRVQHVGLISGTEAREAVHESVLEDAAFRRGVIYAAHNQWPRSLFTVDIAVVKDDTQLLLGRKRTEPGLWRVPGGFVDAADSGAEAAARRELLEETGLTVEGELEYVGNFQVHSWRETPDARLFTNLYLVRHSFGAATAADDLDHVAWVPFGELAALRYADDHARLVGEVLQKLGRTEQATSLLEGAAPDRAPVRAVGG